jgi:hypothetical protein
MAFLSRTHCYPGRLDMVQKCPVRNIAAADDHRMYPARYIISQYSIPAHSHANPPGASRTNTDRKTCRNSQPNTDSGAHRNCYRATTNPYGQPNAHPSPYTD